MSVNGQAVQRRTLRVLTVSQVLGGVGVASGIAVGGLLAADINGSATAAGIAQACTTIGAALLAQPLARLMSRRGRRPGLAAGYAAGFAGAVCVLVAAQTRQLWLVFPGMALFGGGSTSNQQSRYAAIDLAVPSRRSRALAVVLWAVTVGAVAGPNLAAPGARLADAIGLARLAGSFVFSLVAYGLAALVIVLLLRPDPLLTARAAAPDTAGPAGSAGPANARRASLIGSLRLVTSTHTGLLGLAAVVVSHTVMVSVMVMTPVHMGESGATLRVVGLVIGVHILGMYAFSPVAGWFADRFGRVTVVLAGALIMLTATGVAGTAPHHGSVQLGVGLFLLGAGWSCGLVAGSTLLTEAVPVAIRPNVQGSTDLLMGLVAGTGGLAAGPVVAGPGYPMLNLLAAVLVLPLLVLALGQVWWSRPRASGPDGAPTGIDHGIGQGIGQGVVAGEPS